MKTCAQIFRNILILCLLVSCTGHSKLKLKGVSTYSKTRSNYDKYIITKKLPKKNHRTSFTVIKYILHCKNASLEKINLMAIEELKKENFNESETLFKTAYKYNLKNAAIENNMAILYELTGRDTLAFQYYMNAMLNSPNDEIIRKNFILLKYKSEKIILNVP